MDTHSAISDSFLDAAIGEALGINSPADTALLDAGRAEAGEPGRDFERDLTETAARLCTASPFMAPPENLRGRILQATAPTAFRIEDYRKATGENMRVYKWGFYAAAVFLMAAALYNISTRNQLAKAYNAYTAEVAQAGSLAHQLQSRNALVNELADPRTQQVTINDDHNDAVARLYVNRDTQQVVAIVPQGLIPEGQTLQVSLPDPNNGDKRVAFQTVTLTEQGSGLKAPAGTLAGNQINVSHLTPDDSNRPQFAGMH